MDELQRLQEENETLRRQIEAHRQQELGSLMEQLSLAKADAAHYWAEAERNANIGREIHRESQAMIEQLKQRIATLERLLNVRTAGAPGRPG